MFLIGTKAPVRYAIQKPIDSPNLSKDTVIDYPPDFSKTVREFHNIHQPIGRKKSRQNPRKNSVNGKKNQSADILAVLEHSSEI